MRILVISDIHANLTAFDAVLADAAGAWDYVWCLGDVVGYGPDPNECLDRLRELPHRCLLGNHDWAAIQGNAIHHFNDDARLSLLWTRQVLREENADYLRSLSSLLVISRFTLAHGSPREPVWEYIMDPTVAAGNFAHFATPYCLVGHTHLPAIFEQEGDAALVEEGAPAMAEGEESAVLAHSGGGDTAANGGTGVGGDRLRVARLSGVETLILQHKRLILNPGSVGQPRDANPAAAYAILDTLSGSWQQRRALYDTHPVQERMRAYQLPERLAQRLAYGW
ncbi:MAG: metallophosphoesterase family protein [Anaerolineaceae bacterium]|nr:metallophosphoesterase family protein [Anaerolineaceae bacterium]MCY3935457.1 metallophosphoesterase family protein [Chloroflexota bacterium]